MKNLLPILLFISISVVFLFGLSKTEKIADGQAIVALRPAPDLQISSFAGQKPHLLQELQGKYILINFFASWCTPCLAELPLLEELRKDKNLIIYGIAWNDKEKNLKNWLNKNGNPYNYIAQDNAGKTAISFGITGVPESFLIDQRGMIILHIKGVLSSESIKKDILPIIYSK